MLSLTHLGIEIALVAAECTQPGWDGPGSLPVGKQQWVDAWTLAVALEEIDHSLPQPIPGADVDGSTWLTYERGESRIQINIRSDMSKKAIGWRSFREGFDRTHECDAARDYADKNMPLIVPRDLIEGIRATFSAATVTHAA